MEISGIINIDIVLSPFFLFIAFYQLHNTLSIAGSGNWHVRTCIQILIIILLNIEQMKRNNYKPSHHYNMMLCMGDLRSSWKFRRYIILTYVTLGPAKESSSALINKHYIVCTYPSR
ncbi:hypothetical protein ACJX0J_038756 [Zea mays]